jgi:hypothetical protein
MVERVISRDEILKGQECPSNLEGNLQGLLLALNRFRAAYGKPMIVNSGYRSPEHNASVGGRPGSAHVLCQAADFRDPTGSLASFCLENVQLLEHCGLWLESPSYTKGWVHLQTRPALHRVFIP